MIGPSVGKNLLELADELKNLSEQEIVMEIQNPQKYPQYLVFTELDRRNKMKAKYAQDQQGPPETTMIEERMMGIQTPPGGIGGAPQGPPQAPQGLPPGPPGPPPQAGPPPGAPGTPNMQAMMMAQGGAPGPRGMAHGGVVRSRSPVRGFNYGGLLDYRQSEGLLRDLEEEEARRLAEQRDLLLGLDLDEMTPPGMERIPEDAEFRGGSLGGGAFKGVTRGIGRLLGGGKGKMDWLSRFPKHNPSLTPAEMARVESRLLKSGQEQVGRAALAGAGGGAAGLAGLTGAVSARDAGVLDGVFPIEAPDALRDWGDKLSTAPYVHDQEGLGGSLPLVLGDPLRAAGSGLTYFPRKAAVAATQLVAGRPAAEGLSESLFGNPEETDFSIDDQQRKQLIELGMIDPDAGAAAVPESTVIKRTNVRQNGNRLPPMPPADMPETFEEWMKSSGANEQSLTMPGFDKGLAQAQIAAALLGARKGRLGEALGEGITAATPVIMAGRKRGDDIEQQGIANRLAYQGLADKKPYYDALSAYNSARAKEAGSDVEIEARQQAIAEAQGDINLGMSLRRFAENMARYGTPEVQLGSKELPEWASMSEEQKEEKVKSIMEQREKQILAEREAGKRVLRSVRGANSGGLVGSSGGTVAEKMNFR